MRRVVITGLGAVTPLGIGVRNSWSGLVNGRCGIVGLQDDAFKSIPCRVAGLVPKGRKADGGWDPSEWLDRGDARKMALFAQYAYAAAQEAIEDAGIQHMSDDEREQVGVNLGSGIGSFEDVYNTTLAYDKGGYSKVSPLFVPRLLINLAAGHISMKFGFRGPSLAPSTACTTGSHAIGDAFNLIRYNKGIPMILAGAAESCIHPLALAGFSRARSLSTAHNDYPARASRPFDVNRDGFVVSEGAGVLVLESLEHARARGVEPRDIYAEVVGYGLASDAHHVTAPEPGGRGAFLAMERALLDAGVEAADVDYVNAHATGTALGDAAENHAIRQLLSASPRQSQQHQHQQGTREQGKEVNVSSSKGALGHLLGAAGAVEGIFTALAIKHDTLPPTINLDEPGPARKGASAEEEQVEDGAEDPDGNEWDMNYVPGTKQEQRVGIALSNSFGFGGTCASLCFKKFED